MKHWNGARWLSPSCDLTVDKLVRQIQENGCPYKTIALDGQQLKLVPAFQPYNGGAVLFQFIDLFYANKSISEWVSPPLKFDGPWMRCLEGALAHQLLQKIDVNVAFMENNIGIIDFEVLFRETIWTVCREGYFIEIALKLPFIDLGTQHQVNTMN